MKSIVLGLFILCLFFTDKTFSEVVKKENRKMSFISQLNREKEALMAEAKRYTLQIFNELANPFNGGGPISKSHGSGFIVDIQGDDMIIFTNRHVIEIPEYYSYPTEAGNQIEKMSDFIFRRLSVGKKYGQHKVLQKADAEVLFVSPIYDFAILKVKIDKLGVGARDFFNKAELVNTAELVSKIIREGRQVLTFGYPESSSEVGTQGTISAISQSMEGFNSVILIDAPINPGNSGGPLIDMETGKVLGINTWKNENADNMGFAQELISIWEEYERFLNNSQYGSRKTPFITLYAEDKNYLTEKGFMGELEKWIPDFSKNYENVLMVLHAQAGVSLYPGDLLLEVNGQTIEGTVESFKKLLNMSDGDHIKVRVFRSGSIVNVEVPILEQEIKTEVFGDYLAFAGFVVRDLNIKEKEILGQESGVIVGATYDDPMSEANPELEGTVITFVQGPAGAERIKSVKDLKNYLSQIPIGSFVHLKSFVGSSSYIMGVRNVLRPSQVLSVPYTGFVDSDMVPLEKFRKNYDFTGFDVANSNLGSQIVSACQNALMGLKQTGKKRKK